MEIGAKKSTARKKDKEKGKIAEYKTQPHTQKKAARQKRKKLMDVFVLFFWYVRVWKKKKKKRQRIRIAQE